MQKFTLVSVQNHEFIFFNVLKR